MGASSTEGVGLGDANKADLNDLAILNNGPSIIFTGLIEATGGGEGASPPNPIAVVSFPYSLPGGADSYVIMLTTENAGAAYVYSKTESNGMFTGFAIATEEVEGTVMYLVAHVGTKPRV